MRLKSKRAITWTPTTIALQKILKEIPEGSYVSLAQIAKQAGFKRPGDMGAAVLKNNPLFKKVLKEKNLKIVNKAGVNFNAKTYLPSEEFREILRTNPQRDFELVETLKGRTTVEGLPWKRHNIQVMRTNLNILNPLYENISRKAILADAPTLMPDAFKQYQNKQLSYGDLKQKVINKRQQVKITPEQREKINKSARERRKLWGPEEKDAARVAAKLSRDRKNILRGVMPTATYKTQFFPKDSVWFNLYETATSNEGREIPKGSKTTIFKSVIPAKHTVDAIRTAKLTDTLTGKTLTYDNFVEFINKNKPGGKNFNEMVAEFEKKQFISQRPELRASLNKLLHPELDPYIGRTSPGEVHHTLGRRANAYDISFAPRSANRLEGNARKIFDSSWKNISKIEDTSKKFSMQRKALTDYVTKMEGVEGITYGIKPGGKIRGAALDFKPWVTKLLESVNSLTNSQKTKVAIELNCLNVAEGGRIGYALGSATIKCVNTKLTNEPVQSSMKLRIADGVGKIKPAATNFLKLLGRGGVKAAPLAALAGVGVLAEPLVKQFRSDDPTTYLTDENQQKGMLIATIEGETPKVDEEILKWQYPGMAAATAAGAVPGAGAVYKQRRAIRPDKLTGPMEKGVGPARAALGLKGVLGKALGATFSPLAVAATLPIGIAAQRAGGTEWGDIATDPSHWFGPAFAASGAEFASRGIKNPLLLKALRLGMKPSTLRMISSKFGLPGLMISGGMWGYDKWKNRSINDE